MADSKFRHGALRDRFHFQKRAGNNDGFGNTNPQAGPFETQFTTDIGLEARNGGEQIIAQRMQGVQPYNAVVRWSKRMLTVNNAWQLLDAREGGTRRLNVLNTPVDPDGKRQWLVFLVTDGKPS